MAQDLLIICEKSDMDRLNNKACFIHLIVKVTISNIPHRGIGEEVSNIYMVP